MQFGCGHRRLKSHHNQQLDLDCEELERFPQSRMGVPIRSHSSQEYKLILWNEYSGNKDFASVSFEGNFVDYICILPEFRCRTKESTQTLPLPV
jgi:hypothetical protein